MIRLWSNRKFERAVEFLQITPTISIFFFPDVIYQLQEKKSNRGDSIFAKFNNDLAYSTRCGKSLKIQNAGFKA